MLKKIYLGIIFVFLFLVFSFTFLAFKIKAEVPVPPSGRVPCEDERDPEFNSGRPYQASPCGDSHKATFCGNQLQIIEDTPSQIVTGIVDHLDVNYRMGDKTYAVDLKDAEFPFMGNTEDVTNSQSGEDALDDASKMNEYVTWYLSGVINKGEYGSDKNTAENLINFSGPVQKLLPGAILDAQRITSIQNALKEVTYLDTEGQSSSEEPKERKEPENHNQIVACGESNLGIFGDITGLGSFKPTQCYSGDGSGAQGRVFRLSSGLGKTGIGEDGWDGSLSIWNDFANVIVSKIIEVVPTLPHELIQTSVLNHWNKRVPPLPWENDPFAFPTRQMTPLEYQKYYNEWRGKTCVIVPILNKLLCFDSILVPNVYSDLYSYVPLGNTVDKNAKNMITGVGIKGSSGTDVELDFPSYKIIEEPILYFPHTKSSLDMAQALNKTFQPGKTEDQEENKWYTIGDVELQNDEKYQCRILDVRSNPGDYLFPEVKPSEVRVYVAPYTVTRIPCKPTQGGGGSSYLEKIRAEKLGEPLPTNDPAIPMSKCQGEVNIEIRMITKTPYAEDIWESTVAGEESTFRKIFPKTGANSPVSCIANLPAETKVTYIPTEGVDEGKLKVTGPLGNNTTDNAKLYFPFIGSVYEYFLKGIQTALRPKGYGDALVNGTTCKPPIACGELPELPKSSTGECSLNSISPRVGDIPQSLKDIVEAAADTYKTPPELILGIMYGEGLFDGGNKKDWTDENVKNWSTCTPVPDCSTSGDDNFMGFFSTDWDTVAKNIRDDLFALDPNRAEPSQCNLLDAVYGVAWNLHDSADGGMNFQCFGLDMNASVPSSCDWEPEQYASAIKISENGFNDQCFTKAGGCAAGASEAACENGDTCEKFSTAGNTSHMACVWDVAHGD